MRSEFVGLTITNVVAREFWLNGDLVDPCCVVYFSGLDRNVWKLSYNDESYCWELRLAKDPPEAGTVDGDHEYRYPIVDLASTHELE